MAATPSVVGACIARIQTLLQSINGAGAYHYNVASRVVFGDHAHSELTPPAVYVHGLFEADTAFGGETGGSLGQWRREWLCPITGVVATADDEETRLIAASNMLSDIVRAIEADASLDGNVRDGQTILTDMMVYSSGPPGAGGCGVCEVNLVFAFIADSGV